MIFNTSNDSSKLEFDEEISHSCLSIQSNSEITEQNFQTILWWTNAVCLPIIAVIGLFCNGLNILVLVSTEQARRMPSW
uniref:G_PROTEIN_RECEP_F1_2 domain-containing protein n=1 Tax=Meloidogyne hapla TaxID=6305 RepID=A0A1I8BZE3_MELHA